MINRFRNKHREFHVIPFGGAEIMRIRSRTVCQYFSFAVHFPQNRTQRFNAFKKIIFATPCVFNHPKDTPKHTDTKTEQAKAGIMFESSWLNCRIWPQDSDEWGGATGRRAIIKLNHPEMFEGYSAIKDTGLKDSTKTPVTTDAWALIQPLLDLIVSLLNLFRLFIIILNLVCQQILYKFYV